MDKVRLAVQHGYRLIKVHEVYEYNVTQYDRVTGEALNVNSTDIISMTKA
jgi:diketogulonate reductase-like aldo/keto reductase